MRLNSTPRMNLNDPDLQRELREHASLVNQITDGRIAGTNNAIAAAPTAGTYAQGDFVRNSAPAEAGTAGSKYVVTGFLCVSSGTPGTFVECRSLTGN